jgi:hypothetical protein
VCFIHVRGWISNVFLSLTLPRFFFPAVFFFWWLYIEAKFDAGYVFFTYAVGFGAFLLRFFAVRVCVFFFFFF